MVTLKSSFLKLLRRGPSDYIKVIISKAVKKGRSDYIKVIISKAVKKGA